MFIIVSVVNTMFADLGKLSYISCKLSWMSWVSWAEWHEHLFENKRAKIAYFADLDELSKLSWVVWPCEYVKRSGGKIDTHATIL